LLSTLTGENILLLPRLSLSHSGNYALCAITNNDSLIGCDIETHKPRVNIDAIAKSFFAENEALLLSNLNEGEKSRFFYRLWTCKEAWLKAQGLGIANGLKRIQINATGFSIDNDSIIDHGWQLFTATQQDYSIALAIHDKNKSSYEINYVAWDFLSEKFYSKQREVMTT
jgi:4'-phosphopantetheinyl transferase